VEVVPVPARPAAGGGRWVDVGPERLGRWTAGFAERHGVAAAELTGDGLAVRAADGTHAWFHLPFGWPPDAAAGPATSAPIEPAAGLAALVAAASASRRFGLVLVRRAATAVGLVEGSALLASKVQARHVQGRTAAGGWSQQRFARRRDNQARAAARSGADAVADVLLGSASTLDGVVTGGDRHAVDALLADPRLAPLARLRSERFLDVAEPRRAVLERAVPAARAVRIRLLDPDPDHDPDRGHRRAPEPDRPGSG
jgi:hypothetical protein